MYISVEFRIEIVLGSFLSQAWCRINLYSIAICGYVELCSTCRLCRALLDIICLDDCLSRPEIRLTYGVLWSKGQNQAGHTQSQMKKGEIVKRDSNVDISQCGVCLNRKTSGEVRKSKLDLWSSCLREVLSSCPQSNTEEIACYSCLYPFLHSPGSI